MKNISIIVSIANNGCIGGNNTLLWKQSSDLKRFKEITTNHPVIMGQKTYESIGRPLPNRMNIVLTDNPEFNAYGCYIAKDIKQAMDMYYNFSYMTNHEEKEIFVVGGGSIYKQFMPYAEKLYITRIHVDMQGDTYFPYINDDEWSITFKESHEKDDKNQYDYTYEIYERK